jgi:hypothetical protein
MAELFLEVGSLERQPQVAPPHLPGLSALGSLQLIQLRLNQVISALSQLSAMVSRAGLTAAPIKASATGLADQVSAWEAAGAPDQASVQLRSSVLALHVQILNIVTAADVSVGKAYGLGRALADLALRPAQSTKAAFVDDFDGRVGILQGWLKELKTLLPDHAATSVDISLDLWSEWINKTAAEDAIWGEPAPWQDGLHPTATLSLATNTLYVQGTRWRSVLTNEMRASDVLNTSEYIKAGEGLLQRVGAIGRRFVRQYWYLLSGGFVLVVGAVVALLLFQGGSGGGLGALGAIAAATGLSWKGIQSSLGNAVRKVEPALWGAELDLAIATGITVLPGQSGVEMTIPTDKSTRPRVILSPGDPAPAADPAPPAVEPRNTPVQRVLRRFASLVKGSK